MSWPLQNKIMGPGKNFEDPELEHVEGSEIQAAVDVSFYGPDNVCRPVFINQDQDLLHLTLDDAVRLHKFLSEAISFIEDYRARTVQ